MVTSERTPTDSGTVVFLVSELRRAQDAQLPAEFKSGLMVNTVDQILAAVLDEQVAALGKGRAVDLDAPWYRKAVKQTQRDTRLLVGDGCWESYLSSADRRRDRGYDDGRWHIMLNVDGGSTNAGRRLPA